MIGDDDVHAERACVVGLFGVRDAAVDGYDEPGAPLAERSDGVAVEAVALGHAVGDVVHRPKPETAQRLHQQRGARDAIRVEVAVHGHRLALAPRKREPFGGVLDIRQRVRVLEESVRDAEEIAGLVCVVDAAPPEEVGDDGGQGSERRRIGWLSDTPLLTLPDEESGCASQRA